MRAGWNRFKHSGQSKEQPNQSMKVDDQSYTDESSESDVIDQDELAELGLIAVHDGEIQFIGTSQSAPALLIVPDTPNLTVQIAGQRIVGEYPVTSDSQIDATLAKILGTREFIVTIADDRLTASIQAVVHLGFEYLLKPQGPAPECELQIEEQQLVPSIHSIAELRELLKPFNLVGDIDEEALSRIATCEQDLELVVVNAKSPVSPSPAHLIALSLQSEYDPMHQRMLVTSVRVGTPIAQVIPTTIGQPGTDIFGGEIPAPEVPETLKLGEGVAQVANQILAARDGRVMVTQESADVVPQLVIDHDVTPHDKHIIFHGDVLVHGSVEDGSVIRASGQLTVSGQVYGANLSAEHGITVAGNVVHSTLLAGQLRPSYERLHPIVSACVAGFKQFRLDYVVLVEGALRNARNATKIPLLAGFLLEHRFAELDQHLQQLASGQEKKLEAFDNWHDQLIQHIRTKWQGAQRTNLTLQDIDALIHIFSQLEATTQAYISDASAAVSLSSLASSVIRATGDVTIKGSGVFASMIESGNEITVKGTLRGGTVVAKQAIRIRELGSETGTETTVRVTDQDGEIVIGTRHPDTTIQVFQRIDKNSVVQYNVKFGADDPNEQHDATQ